MVDFTDISHDVRQMANKECNRIGHELVLMCKYSSQESDENLYRLIAKKLYNNTYTVWGYDSRGAMFSGKYDLDFKTALGVLAEQL